MYLCLFFSSKRELGIGQSRPQSSLRQAVRCEVGLSYLDIAAGEAELKSEPPLVAMRDADEQFGLLRVCQVPEASTGIKRRYTSHTEVLSRVYEEFKAVEYAIVM